MNILIFVFMFCLGNIIGSFLNVVIYRFNTGRNLGGHSSCMTCSNRLNWYEMIPVMSFLFQKGRCGKCASRISHQYPLVEFSTGLVFALLTFHFIPFLSVSIFQFVFLLTFFSLIFSILIVIAVYDIRHKIIPDTLVYSFIFLSFISMFINYNFFGNIFILPTINHIFLGPLFAIPFALIWYFSKGKWIGLGDAKIILGIGWLMSFSKSLSVLVLSFWLGAIVSLFVLFFSKKKGGMKIEIPFAPFLILALLIVIILDISIYDIAMLFVF